MNQADPDKVMLKRSPMTKGKVAEFIDSTRWGRDFEWSQLEQLSNYFDPYVIPRSAILFSEGSRDAYMGLIVSGKVKIHKTGESGKNRRICVLGSGQAFGEMSLIDGYPRSATVVAMESVTLLILSREKFNALCAECPQLAVRLIIKISKLMSERLRQTSGILIDYLDEGGR